MDFETKQAALEKIYALYDEFVAGLDPACRKGCAICCTANVTLTTLEGLLLLPQIGARGLAEGSDRGFRPKITTNHMAALCMDGKKLPEEAVDPAPGPCPFLTDGICPVYAVRPFGCRCMVSSKNCAETGMADMDDWVITVNHLFMQFIEHLDGNGCSGNMAHVLAVLSDPGKRAEYESATLICRAEGLIPNRPIPILMIPPEYRAKAMPLVGKLRSCVSE